MRNNDYLTGRAVSGESKAIMSQSLAEQYNGGVGDFHSDTDDPIDHEGSDDEAEGGKKEEEELDPLCVREELLSYLEELEAVENGDSDEEESERGKKYNHLPWRGRCWNVSDYSY